MNGKEMKVIEYNLTYGSSARLVNVLGCFKYKANDNLYVVYSDIVNSYNIIYYGSSHIKDKSILSMQCKNEKDEEIIKEYIYKVTNKEDLSNFEIISLDNIDGIEIISSNKLEIKKDILDKLVELTIPKKEIPAAETKVTTNKKKNSKLILLLPLLILILGVGLYIYLTPKSENTSDKKITCTKQYQHDVLPATINEEQNFNFNSNDTLESIDVSETYTFNSEEDYLDFINEGTYYKYMPENDTEGGWNKDDEQHIFTIYKKERITTGYKKPTEYEEVLSYYKLENYSCSENIEE